MTATVRIRARSRIESADYTHSAELPQKLSIAEQEGAPPDRRARVLSEHDTAIRAAAERMTALLTSDAQIATMLSAYGIQLRAVLSH